MAILYGLYYIAVYIQIILDQRYVVYCNNCNTLKTKYTFFGKSEVPLYTWKDEEALYLLAI